MKTLLKFALIAVVMMFPRSLYAAGESGKVILDLQPEVEESKVDGRQLVEGYWSDVKFFDAKYPGQLIEEDFSDEIRRLYPEDNDSVVNTRENMIRYGVRARRIYNLLLEKAKELIVNTDIPLIVGEDEYESGGTLEYIDSEEPVIIQDFKKIIAYSQAERDRRAYAEKLARDRGEKGVSQQKEELRTALLNLDWKKIFSYGLFDGREAEDRRGIGEWAGEGILRARLLAESKTLRPEVATALQIVAPAGYFFLAEDFAQYPGISVRFSGFQNSESAAAQWPLPRRYNLNRETLVGYNGSIVAPLTVEPPAAEVPLNLRAEIKVVVCGKGECKAETLTSELELRPGEAGESEVAGFLRLARLYVPKEARPELQIKTLAVEKSVLAEEADVLRVELEAKRTPPDFDIFIRDEAGSRFHSPLISINGRKIIARFKAVDAAADLTGRRFTVSARLSDDIAVKQSLIAEDASLFDVDGRRLTLALLWFGLLGGLLLNLMPCVFPVLSLKVLSFTCFGSRNISAIRRGFLFNLLGIYTSFAVLTLVLLVLKLAGAAVGWGMQFQNIYFLTGIIFVVAAFLAHVMGLIHFRAPAVIGQFIDKHNSEDDLLHFLTGLFLVLLSTPCTAPYLGTALGFALAGSVGDIVVMMAAVGTGLSLPYLLFALMPSLAYYMPAPGPWMRRLNFLMAAMLVLTLVWLLSILAVQTAGAVIWHFVLLIGVFLFVLWFRQLILQNAEHSSEPPEILRKLRRLVNLVTIGIVLVLAGAAAFDARHSYLRGRRETSGDSVLLLNSEEIRRNVAAGRIVLVRVGADWCLTCKFNDAAVFETPEIIALLDAYNVVSIDIDWTSYNPEVLAFMDKFGRRGLPFYVIFAPRIPGGMVLPEIVSDSYFRELLNNLRY